MMTRAASREYRATILWFALVLFAALDDPRAAARTTQASSLKIVVIAGEDAVNIIQQKTAVAPIVEVRDRNDQPVAGAVVNFAIRSGRATFGGARTLAVTTDALGRAVATGLTPTGTGALQIGASAAFQGQTAAAVTITQTNVLTAAQAAAVGATTSGGGTAAGTGGAAGGSGGINGLTIGLLGAGAAGATLVALNAKNDDGGGSTSGGPPPSPSVLYSIVMTPVVSNITQCPVASSITTAGPFGTSISFQQDGSFSGDLFGDANGMVPAVRISGRWTATDVTGTLVCIGAGGPSGGMSGTGSRTQYQGTWNFGSVGGTFNLTQKP